MAVGLAFVAFITLSGVMIYRHDQRVTAAAVEKINRANDVARDAADQGQRGPLECVGVWNRSSGKCE
jgi:hypothetical protein